MKVDWDIQTCFICSALYLAQIVHSNHCTNNKGVIRGGFSLCTRKIANISLASNSIGMSSTAQ